MISHYDDTYRYNADNQRVVKTGGGETTYYIKNGMETLVEYDGNGEVDAEYFYGVDGIVAKHDVHEGLHWFCKDHLGSTRNLNNNTMQMDYYPFGEALAISGSETDYLFSGKELDSHTTDDLYYFGARYYDASIGRWLVPDPASNLHPEWTPFHYCFNNPLQFVDPVGMDTTDSQNSQMEQDTDETNNNVVEVDGVKVHKKLIPELKKSGFFNAEQLKNVYYSDNLNFKVGKLQILMTEGGGITGSSKISGNVNIYFGSDDKYYANVSAIAHTTASNTGSVNFYGSVDLLSGKNIINSYNLKKISGPSIGLSDWDDVGQAVFTLPNTGTSDMFLKFNIGYTYTEGTGYVFPIPAQVHHTIRIGSIVDTLTY